MGYIAAGPARVGGLERRRARHHRDVVGPARRRCATRSQDARPHRQAVRRQHRAALRPRSRASSTSSLDNGVRVRDDVGRRPDASTRRRCKEAGLTVFHVVPIAARRAEGGRRRRRRPRRRGRRGRRLQGSAATSSTMVLLPLVCSKVDVPVIAAGGICDGRSMAAAFVLGAEGVQMGTRMVSRGRVAGARQLEAAHRRLDRDRHGASSTAGTSRLPGPARRSARRSSSRRAGRDRVPRPRSRTSTSAATSTPSFAFGGQVAGRIDEVRPVAEIIDETITEFYETITSLGARSTGDHA